ncbi:hypothetical protein BSKO_01481 [Bryopsis sp. KO-2023]|nr:hypothetical protein BSKO_01481 [Bryopsis sp. KO-2023]
MFRSQQGKGVSSRRSQRTRKVAQQVAVVDEDAQKQAIRAHLDSLEKDHDFAEAEPSDEEFKLESDEEIDIGTSKRRKKNMRGKRTTRSTREKRGVKSFSILLKEAELDQVPDDVPTYLTAAAKPAKTSSKRKFCSVCGNISLYTCTRCGSRFCCLKCHSIHKDTRCLKFMA